MHISMFNIWDICHLEKSRPMGQTTAVCGGIRGAGCTGSGREDCDEHISTTLYSLLEELFLLNEIISRYMQSDQ